MADVSAIVVNGSDAEGGVLRATGGAWVRHVDADGMGLKRHADASLVFDGFDRAGPCGVPLCAPRQELDATAIVGLSHYAWGRVDLGRRGSLAPAVGNAAHAWGGDTIAGDGCAVVLLAPCPRYRPLSLTYVSPSYTGVVLAGQVAGGEGAPATTARVEYRRGPLYVGAAYAALGDGRWTAPLGAVIGLGRWQLFGTLVRGRASAGAGRHEAIGASTPWGAGEWRIGASRSRLPGLTETHKLATSLHLPVSHRVIPFASIAKERRAGDADVLALEAGVKLTY